MSEVVIIIRPSFKKICGDDACRAAVFNHFLYWIAKKVKSGAEYWYGSFEEIWESLDRSWGLSKTIQEIKALVADGFIGQRRNPKNGWDQTRHYYFGVEQAETLRVSCEKHGVCLAHIGLCADVTHLLNLTNAFSENNKCICSNQQIDLLDLPDRFVESNDAIPKVTTKVTTKDNDKQESTIVANATAPTSSPSDNSQDDEITEKRKVLQKTITQDNQSKHPPAPTKPKFNIPKHRQDKPITMPSTPEEKAFQARCAHWYKHINEWCGGPMTRAGAVINEHKAIKALCEQWSDKEIGDELEYLTTKDWKWSKIDNKYKVRGYVLLDEAGAVKRILDNPTAHPNEHKVSSFGTPGYNFADEFYPSEAEKRAYYAAHPLEVMT
jgi:hypothetical protein